MAKRRNAKAAIEHFNQPLFRDVLVVAMHAFADTIPWEDRAQRDAEMREFFDVLIEGFERQGLPAPEFAKVARRRYAEDRGEYMMDCLRDLIPEGLTELEQREHLAGAVRGLIAFLRHEGLDVPGWLYEAERGFLTDA